MIFHLTHWKTTLIHSPPWSGPNTEVSFPSDHICGSIYSPVTVPQSHWAWPCSPDIITQGLGNICCPLCFQRSLPRDHQALLHQLSLPQITLPEALLTTLSPHLETPFLLFFSQISM